MNTYQFSKLEYQKTDYEQAAADIRAMTKRVQNASSADEILAINREYDALLDEISYASNLAYIRMSLDAGDPFYAEAVQHEMSGASKLPDAEYANAVLGSPHFNGVEERLGKEARRQLEKNAKLRGNGLDLIAKESELTTKYQQMKAMLRIPFHGKEYSEGEMRARTETIDRAERREALEAILKAFAEKKDAFLPLLRELTETRTQIARANGFDNCLAYMNLSYDRNDYGEAELSSFCDEVRTHLVPLVAGLHKKQAARLGIDDLHQYDLKLRFPDGNASPSGDVKNLTSATAKMYRTLSPEIGAFFDKMVTTESFDVTPSDKKVSGMGFATILNSSYYPFVFANCNGTESDIQVFTHEIGHAWQFYQTFQKGHPAMLRMMVHDACEIPSKTMELLTFPAADLFFGASADKFRYSNFCTALEEMTAFCEEHEFEGYVLTHPGASFEELATERARLDRIYFPLVTPGELEPYYRDGIQLFRNMSLYMFPRYVMGYALAEVCAMQFYERYLDNPARTISQYNDFCSLGGSLSYPEMLGAIQMAPSYEQGSVKALCAFAEKMLGKLETAYT